eukprot:CAMPEP_0206027588 /NCGR_PEP_ID=MMETSP1464-20131121/43510_1 /ASSEMBLY_ACC=CAM_ASM_001124 /TAXON_ID=119497 /ORGANISM="Exanthemachrysis gayraliae, Strain RCC1523" /LENGTH=50 /DNA_ID=CAMNT_0053401631 /DNA_START=310 /DNA_END=462 /DNA_ORIENTATION=+
MSTAVDVRALAALARRLHQCNPRGQCALESLADLAGAAVTPRVDRAHARA